MLCYFYTNNFFFWATSSPRNELIPTDAVWVSSCCFLQGVSPWNPNPGNVVFYLCSFTHTSASPLAFLFNSRVFVELPHIFWYYPSLFLSLHLGAETMSFWFLCPSYLGSTGYSVRLVCFVAQSCPTLCDLMYCSPPGSSVHGILQAR